MTNQLPHIRRVRPGSEPCTLAIRWAAATHDGTRETVDMTGVIARFAPFEPLLDPAVFATVHTVYGGGGIAWEGGLDFSASSLELLAEEQQAMNAAELRAWQDHFAISNSEAANTLGVSLRSYAYYRDGRAIPKALAAFVRAMAREPAVFAAHYRPAAKVGRPRVAKSQVNADRISASKTMARNRVQDSAKYAFSDKLGRIVYVGQPLDMEKRVSGNAVIERAPAKSARTSTSPTRTGGKSRRQGGDAA